MWQGMRRATQSHPACAHALFRNQVSVRSQVQCATPRIEGAKIQQDGGKRSHGGGEGDAPWKR
eukprot:8071460-Alexandrium_andersonii.AAC.1